MCSIAYAAALWLQTYLTLCNPMAVALQAHLSMGFSSLSKSTRVGCHPKPGFQPGSPALQTESLR